MKTPYIGITGFMTRNEVFHVLKTIPMKTGRLIIVGVLASQKTIQGIPNKRPNRYPEALKISDIFPNDPRVINLIHYNTKEQDTLGYQLLAITELGGKNLNGLQLNMAWPSPDVLEAYKKVQPAKQIVLQIGGRAFKIVNDSPRQLAAKVTEYEGIIDYVLLDPSGGLGRPLDTERIREYLYTLKAKNLNIGLGTAGGLSPTTLGLIGPLVKKFPNLSVDAEGLVRTPDDNLDLNKAREFPLEVLSKFN